MQVIGLCRFSCPTIGGFQIRHDTPEARAAFLYDPVRMNARFAMFEAFTLPCLKAQTDPDFTFLIVTGADLPEPFFRRLQAVTADLPQAVIQRHSPGQHRALMRKAINSQRSDPHRPCLQFRLDDDDAVSIDFVAQLRSKAACAAPLLAAHRTVAIDFNSGYVAQPCREGILAAPVTAAYWSPALGMMIAPGADISVMNFSHHRVWKSMPTLTFTGEDMMVRGLNDHNDSRQKPTARQRHLSLLDKAGEATFLKTFNIDAGQIRRDFSAA